MIRLCTHSIVDAAMYSLLTIGALLGLQLLPFVKGDCWDDEYHNNRTFDNCATCYQTLANALINTADNKYELGKAFFPDNDTIPIEVQIHYIPVSQSCYSANNCTTVESTLTRRNVTWHWLINEYYIYQPTYLFLFRSLYLSPPVWRNKCVHLYLPDSCLPKYYNEDFFKYLTQRVSY